MSIRTCPTCLTALPDDAAYCSLCGLATATQILGDEASTPVVGRVSASYESEPERLQRVLGPNHELGRLIGRGGYAEVFAVRDLKLNRDLAIKVLRPDLIVTPNLLARFRREAQAVAALHHPNIVPVFDVGEAGGICYIVMPLVQGESLKELMAREGPLPVPEARRVLLEAAGALAATHEAGVVHRDIKPENIVLEGRNRHVRIMDFGIAKAMDAGDRELTGTGVVVGTPQYMSPEQASGDSSVDHRTDQYSLAAVGYQMLSGRLPFDGETARAIITKVLLDRPARLDHITHGLPAPLVATIHRALEKDPGRRFASIEEFAAALRGERAPEFAFPAEPRRARRPVSRWLVGAGVAVAASVATAAAIRSGRTQTEELSPPPRTDTVTITAPAVESRLPPPPAPPPAPGAVSLAVTPRADSAAPLAAPPADSALRPVAPPIDCSAAYRSQDWDEALTRCRAEAEAGSPMAGRLAARMLAQGLGTAASQDSAARYYGLAAAAGDPESAFEMGRRYERTDGGVPRDPTRATEMYLDAANGGHRPAFAVVARRLDQGLGVPRNERQAAAWYARAARESNDAPSQVALGRMYAEGRGVPKDEAEAVRLFTAAASANADAQYELGMAYLRGRGVARSDSLGLVWLERAAREGHAAAERELARRRG